jgi:hypothetical protein
VITRGQIRAQREAHDWLDAATGRQKLLDRTRDGDEVVDFLLSVMRGARFRWPQLHPKETGVLIRPTGEQRLRVALVLAERLWGRPPAAGAEGASVTSAPPVAPITDEEATRLRDLFNAVVNEAPPVITPSGGDGVSRGDAIRDLPDGGSGSRAR